MAVERSVSPVQVWPQRALTIIDFDREVRYSLQQLRIITTLESDAKRMYKGAEVVMLRTALLLSLVRGWAVGKACVI